MSLTVLVDIDGTLTGGNDLPSSEQATADPLVELLAARNGLDPAVAKQAVDKELRAVTDMVGSVWPFGVHRKMGVSDEALWEHLRNEAKRRFFVHPDAQAFLRELKSVAGVRVYTATTNPRRIILAKLAVAGLAEMEGSAWLDDAFGGEEVSPGGKLGPAFFTAILARVNADPDRTLMIGDDWMADARFAREAGVRRIAIVCRTPGNVSPESPDGTMVVDRLTALLPLIHDWATTAGRMPE